MPKVISNTSCLIALDNIQMLPILKKLYKNIYITEEVSWEFGENLEDWIEIRRVKDKNYMNILNNLIDLGEASTVALSLETANSLMILDDQKARKVAKTLELNFTGLLGVVLRAKERKIIDSVQEVINKLKSAGFRISEKMEAEVLRLANE